MKKDQVQVGGRYSAKVSGSVVEVRITGERWVGDEHRGWNAVNTQTNRPVVIKSAQRLRAEVGAAPAAKAAPAAPFAPDAPKANRPPADAPGANVAPAAANRAAPVRAIKVIGAKPVQVSDEVAVLVDRRTPPEAIPVLEREATRMRAAGSPRPPAAKAKGKKPAKAPRAKADKPKRMSGLDAVAKVLAEAGKPMSAKEMTDEAIKRGLWKTGGKTPEATTYAAIIRDIAARGRESRFRKVARGQFAAAGKGA